MTRHWFILGPTASGKSAVARELARQTGGVVANLDAFQVYGGLDIGTAKPTLGERADVPHTLFDLAGPCDDYSVAEHLRHAAEFLSREKRPVIWVGGTGLYYRALTRGLAEAPATEPGVRAELDSLDLETLREEILRVDPVWAAGADLSNPRRIVRALAVFRQTGRPLSAWQADPVRALVPEGRACLLLRSAESLHERIAARVRAMWEAGWPDEVRRLLEIPGWEGSSSSHALGYAEVAAWCRNGGDSKDVRDQIVTRTRQYARRQLTWLRRENNLECIELDERSDPPSIARTLVRDLPPACP
ncbi:MAG: tRNA (adenosine(37)-N6)-dimethylallyltransferase MiaA [Candidatus Methylacidiphilales bacterium]|nr:tRNA (adenosine(37)-N6)-dimethylallyltransferase MiaA [Candidatus Methylacidiphilales bacterium]